jgi:hypothetical protein
MLLVIGTVVQDVVADAMSTEVVPRHDAAGNERPRHKVRTELGMVQVLGRLAVSAGVLTVSGLSGWLANFMRRQDVFLVGLIVPAISVAGVFLRGTETKERRPIDWRILGGGIAFGIVVAVGVSGVPFGQEIIFVISMAVVSYMLVLVTAELDHDTRVGILFAAIIVFAFRAAPRVGDGFFWWTLDELKFDAAFYGTLRQTGAILSIAVMWMFSRQLTEAALTLFWIVVAGTVLSMPNIALVYGFHRWTEAVFGFGARSIAFVDAAVSSPFLQLSMVPLLTLTAYYAPPGHDVDEAVKRKNYDEAIKLYREAIEILDDATPRDDGNVFESYIKIGDILDSRADRDGALKEYKLASGIALSAATSSPDSVKWQRNLAKSYDKIGDVFAGLENPREAITQYQHALEILKALAAKYPQASEWRAFAESLNAKIGKFASAQ